MSKRDAIEVPQAEWLELHRKAGLLEGLLWGWLHWDGTPEHMERLQAVTTKHLKGEGDE